MSEEIEKTEEEKKLKAKPVSLIGQIVAAFWVAGWSAFNFMKNVSGIKITDIIMSGLAIAACFSPVYFNMLLDKIKEIKLGGEK